jgi:hypothetical protein
MSYDESVRVGGHLQEQEVSQPQQYFSLGTRSRSAKTDAFSPPPALEGAFSVRCDECGQEYSYNAKDVARIEFALPARFIPHPFLFVT